MNYALIFAGGVGSRMNSKARPKQFLEIHGKPIIVHTLEQFENHPEIDGIVIVIVADWLGFMKSLVDKFHLTKVLTVVPGGSTALDSQYRGICALKEVREIGDKDVLLVHDGVRPMIDEETISACIASVKAYGSAITVAPAIETIIQVDEDQNVSHTIARSECMLARAPQCFLVRDLADGHERALAEGRRDFVDSASMMLYYGAKLHTVAGPAENIKVTNPADFYICRALLDARESSQIFGL